jgi:hypothetical protein
MRKYTCRSRNSVLGRFGQSVLSLNKSVDLRIQPQIATQPALENRYFSFDAKIPLYLVVCTRNYLSPICVNVNTPP